MGILADEQWAVNPLRCPVLHDCLRRGGDVEVVEGGIEAGAAMSRGTKNHLLVGIAGVGGQVVVGRKDGVDVDEIGFQGHQASSLMCHAPIFPLPVVGIDPARKD